MNHLTTTQPNSLAVMPLADVKDMAVMVSKSGLFPGINTPESAATLMLLCQSEGLHPLQALKRYHIIEGRPSMRADAMQAEFQARGGKIHWLKTDAAEARARITHPAHAPDGLELAVTFDEMRTVGITHGFKGIKDNWRKHPAAMLRARLISMAVRMVLPEIVAGIYTPEEIQDFGADGKPAPSSAKPLFQAKTSTPEAAPAPDVQDAEATPAAATEPAQEPEKAAPASTDWAEFFGSDLPDVLAYAKAKGLTRTESLNDMAPAMQARFQRDPAKVTAAAKTHAAAQLQGAAQ